MGIIDDFLVAQRSKRQKVYCIGDSMIDEYYDVRVNRISPEFPMPIMVSNTDEPVTRPGGVANVSRQYKHFNVDSTLVCFTDTAAVSVFREAKLNYVPCTTLKSYVPRKRRFLDGKIQVKRWDVEKDIYDLSDADQARRDSLDFTKHLSAPDLVILSDYNKGFFSPDFAQQWIQRYKDSVTLVDPKKGPLDQWKGCKVFKPNAAEARDLSGRTNWKDQCDYFRKVLECECVAITLAGYGVVGWDKDYFEYRPDYSIEPESVVGAGDCFAALFGLAYSLGFSGYDSSKIGFEAGVIYVQRNKNRPVVPAELVPSKVVSAEDLTSRDFKLVLTDGYFDKPLTAEYVEHLNHAKKQGDKLVVALRSSGGSYPDQTAIISNLRSVDFVILSPDENLVTIIKPDVTSCNDRS